MRGKKVSLGLRAATVIFFAALFATSMWAASESVLHSFNPHVRDGVAPYAGLVSDADGNLYGTTTASGSNSLGAVFELSPNGSGGWTAKVLYNFRSNGADGAYPYGGLILDGAGNLYGTTIVGGDYGGGTAFELSPNGSGGWTEKKLHNFGNATDGLFPESALIFDTAGNLYGTTADDFLNFAGTVFELMPNGSGGWTEKILHRFNPANNDGNGPYAALIFDGAGNLYGTTVNGGDSGAGTVFELTPNGGGGWTEKKLHNFNYFFDGVDGAFPYGGVIFDAAGNLYGTTGGGGDYSGAGLGSGTVFEMSPNGSGGWTEKKLHNFGINGADGIYPNASLIQDGAGNLYGTTYSGGDDSGGTVFKLTPNGSGGWTETKLHSFGNGKDGFNPEGSLIVDAVGNLYSTTFSGGSFDYGTVFKLSPGQGGTWTESVLHSFNLNGQDGVNPFLGSLVSDAAGNLYGTEPGAGAYGFGIVFELTPNGDGGWTETVLHNFKGDTTDGGNPYGTLIFDGAGSLYGTTQTGGHHGEGTAFELTPNGSGGWTEKILHNFGNGTDGASPFAGLIFDAGGNLYGATYKGGSYGDGTVFQMTPNGSGGWTEKKLHNFNPNHNDGSGPYAGLILDSAGNLYGTTGYGGNNGTGTVFELTPNGSGGWTEKKLHDFAPFNYSDGVLPYGGVILDTAGNLYGTTSYGGADGTGIVFELTPNGSGHWTENIIYTFNFNSGTDGSAPDAGLIFDHAGNLYGTTSYGGDHNAGSVFELSPNGSGGWTETKLYDFYSTRTDGIYPESGVIFDHAGNLYGMTNTGGTNNYGTVFEITP